MRDAAASAERIVVVGAGFIGMEAASQFSGMNKRVTVIAKEDLPFAKQFGAAVAGQILARHRKEGVDVRGGAAIEALEAENGRVVAVRLQGGERMVADLVLAATGAAPRAQIVDPAAEHGLAVDGFLQHAPDLYLGGDIAAVPLPSHAEPVRIEHWRVAEQHGQQAARAMMDLAGPFRDVPFFWSGQYDRISMVGHARSVEEVHVEGDLDAGSYTAFVIEHGRVTAGIGRGDGDRTAALHALMLSDPTPRRERLEAVNWDPARLIEA